MTSLRDGGRFVRRIILAALTGLNATSAQAGFSFHSSITPSQQLRLEDDYARLVREAAVDSRALRFLSVLDSGVKVIFGPSFDFVRSIEFELVHESKENSSSLIHEEPKGLVGRTKTFLALNLGLRYWSWIREGQVKSLSLLIDGDPVPVLSPSIGFVYLGEEFFSGTAGLSRPGDSRPSVTPNAPQMLDSIRRIGVLLHEARHSDCHDSASCGHPHVLCPAGSIYGGLSACDSDAQGGIGVELDYLNYQLRTNRSLGPEQKDQLKTEIESLRSRIRGAR